MKRLQRLLFLGGLLLTAPLYAWMPTLAENPNYLGNQSEWDTFGGFDFKQSWIPAREAWKSLVQATGPALGFYAGQRIHPYIAYELGYGWSVDKIRQTSVPNGSSLLGVSNADLSGTPLKGRFHLKTAYLDLNLLLPLEKRMDHSPEWVFSFGVAMMKPVLNITTNDTAVSLAFVNNLKGSAKAAARVGLGIQSFLIGNVGMRLMWRFENTGVLRISNGVDQRFASFLGNGQSLSLGLFMRL